MPGVFISYRKDDTRPWAIILRDHLAREFGERQIFVDVDSIEAGPWRTQIQHALDRCAVVVVLIGPRWMTAADASGASRLFAADDVHRHEVGSALKRSGVTVIPVLVDAARLPAAADLPEDLRGLLECQATEIADARDARAASLRRLIALVDARLGQRRVRRGAAAAALAVATVAVINTMVNSESVLVATAFLIAATCLAVYSAAIYRRMNREHVRGAWVALGTVIVAAAMMIGSIVRLAMRITQQA